LIERFEKRGEIVEINREEGYIVVAYPEAPPVRFAKS
jgi:hypothetical protein